MLLPFLCLLAAPFKRQPQGIFCLHLVLSSESFSLAPVPLRSSFSASVNLLLSSRDCEIVLPCGYIIHNFLTLLFINYHTFLFI